jgi:2'-5' RNA ligase
MSDLNRCWLGFPFAADLHEKIKAAQMQIRKRAGGDTIRWLPQGETALLLVTIGEVGSNTLLRIGSVVEQVVARHSAINLALEGAGGSPNVTMPKSAWIGVSGDVSALKKLRQDLSVCVRPLVTAIDDREYEAVVEVGLLRKFDERERTEMGRALKLSNLGVLGEFRLDAVHVLASRATTAGPALHSLKSFPLS